ncbi:MULTISPECIES: GTPase HflX [Halorussus]|uniref:GTPase HflX n=1 Tax=Halorussus TaxID=1070314 RepID=UPI000E21046B|nr:MULTISPECIES: GTPase HflX [Halorussus]NHN61494.1 GTPase HflX [Halorussus sp. JP-T4]
MQSQNAVIAKRADPDDADAGVPDATEIRRLTEAAEYEVVAEVTQTRTEHPATNLGPGKVEQLAGTAAETGADAVVVDNDLSPTQSHELGEACPEGTAVLDRQRLVLDIFAERAGGERAALQVERARLAYDLPRVREQVTRELAGEDLAHDEQGGQRVRDVERRIDELDRKLAERGDDAAARRERRREEGFEFVALAGYTNAGKSTLLHRLADDLDFEAREPDHADLDGTAEIRDRLFETLDTTTRRATIEGRRTLATDTVGFVDDLPHETVASFHDTLSATGDADCVALVVDASDPPGELRRKIETGLDLLADAEGEVVPVLNKVDLLDEDALAEREDAIRGLVSDPVAVSAAAGRNLDALRERLAAALPDRRAVELVLPNRDEAMSLVSWLYDRADVSDVTYGGDEVRVAFEAGQSIVERAEAKADALGGEPIEN